MSNGFVAAITTAAVLWHINGLPPREPAYRQPVFLLAEADPLDDWFEAMDEGRGRRSRRRRDTRRANKGNR